MKNFKTFLCFKMFYDIYRSLQKHRVFPVFLWTGGDPSEDFYWSRGNYLDSGDERDDDEPEPEEDVDLLVDDVQRQHAQRVELLDRTGGTELVELTLGHLHTSKEYV